MKFLVVAAKFSNLEQADWDPKPGESAEAPGIYFEGTGEVGTYFYTAPEMDQGLPHIDVKVRISTLDLTTPWQTIETVSEVQMSVTGLVFSYYLLLSTSIPSCSAREGVKSS